MTFIRYSLSMMKTFLAFTIGALTSLLGLILLTILLKLTWLSRLKLPSLISPEPWENPCGFSSLTMLIGVGVGMNIGESEACGIPQPDFSDSQF